MKISIYLLSLIISSQVFAQEIPQLVTTPQKSRENVEAYMNSADYQDQKRLLKCYFYSKNEKGKRYQLELKTSGQNDLKIQIGKTVTRGSSRGSSIYGSHTTYQSYEKYFETIKHANDYNDFLQNFIERFAERGNSQLMLNACTYDQTQWDKAIDQHLEEDISITLEATSRERTKTGKVIAFLGVSLSELSNLTSQTYRFLIAGDNAMDRLALVYLTNPWQVASAAAFSEDLSGHITIGNDEYELTSCKANQILPHYKD